MTTDFTPWSTAAPLLRGTASAWIPEAHQARIRAYELYEHMYWNVPETFRLVMRGTDNPRPIYIPNPRILVDTVARYVAKQLGFAATAEAEAPNPLVPPGEELPGSEADAVLAQRWFNALFRRERFFSRFAANKLYGLVRGDYLWHVWADPNKLPGRRITIQTVHPRSYFPLYIDPTDPTSLRGVFLADLVTLGDKQYVRRQHYWKELAEDGTPTIMSSLAFFKPEPDKWFAQDAEPESVPNVQVLPPAPLDPRIQAIPVYQIQNNPGPNESFGNSELRGLERVLAAVNQSISDEDLILVLEGLGIYATDADPPVDGEGKETKWVLGPGRVLEHDQDRKFYRVNGVSTVGPFLEHVRYIEGKLDEAAGINDVAKGKVEVSVAESGVALALRLDPLFSRVDYMETFITDVLNQQWYDLQTGWLPVYEGVEFPGVVLQPTYGSKLPVNRKERFLELNQMLQQGVITTEFYLSEAEKLGYTFPDGVVAMAAAARAELQARTDATVPSEPEIPLAGNATAGALTGVTGGE